MIYSDDWSVYRNLEDIGYEHEIVNHSVEFVNENGAHTNTMLHRQNFEWLTVKGTKTLNGLP